MFTTADEYWIDNIGVKIRYIHIHGLKCVMAFTNRDKLLLKKWTFKWKTRFELNLFPLTLCKLKLAFVYTGSCGYKEYNDSEEI